MNTRQLRACAAARWPLSALAIALLLYTPAPGFAQSDGYQISQRATVSQKLATTLVTLDYARPRARGRAPLFGKVVHWGEVWTPGANKATVLELSTDVKLDGHAVPAGRWSVWLIPSQVGPWEVLLDARDTLFHTQRPKLTGERQVRFTVQPQEQPEHVEVLTWSFPRIDHDGGTLQLNWGTTKVALEIAVESARPVTAVAAEEAALYVGEWELTFVRPGPTGQTRPPIRFQVSHAPDGSLVARFPPGAFGGPPEPAGAQPTADAQLSPQERERAEADRLLGQQMSGEWSFVLVPRARGVFLLGYIDNGELAEVEEIFHEFEVEGGRAVRLTIRDDKDAVWGRATPVR